MSWQAKFTSFMLRNLFKTRLARAQGIEQIRKVMNGPGAKAPRGIRVMPAVVGGIAGEWLTADSPPRATLLYLHGGGYVACSPGTHRALTSAFALAGYRTFAADYRLAPEDPFPAALDDAVDVYRALLSEGGGKRIVVAGDSAGGGLVMSLLLSLRDQGLQLPAAAVLFSPFVDLAVTGESVQRNAARCAMFRPESFSRAAQLYLGDQDVRTPLASPLYADLHGLPPLLIHVGEDETLLDDSLRLADRAQQAGALVQLKVWPSVPHVWQLMHRFIPEGRASIAEACTFLRLRV